MSTKPKPNNKQNSNNYDVIIVGGGMVGASLAVALMPLKLNVAVVDAFQFGVADQPSYDDRSIALSYGSSLIFKGMDLWDQLRANTTAINKIHVSDRGHFGAARLTAEQEKVPALGYLVESRTLGKLLYDVLGESDVDLIVPASVNKVEETADSIRIELDKDGKKIQLKTRLLVAADGTESKVRELSEIEVKRADYQQSAIVANVSTEKPHQGQAFERFTDKGPIALLPMSENRCSLVWTHSTKDSNQSVEETMALSDETFLEKLGEEFGFRLGRFIKVGKRSAFPLSLVTANKNTTKRTVIIGNASHTLHPVAGQGLNLALRDVAVLTDLIDDYISQQDGKLGNVDSLLQAYEIKREGDLKNTVRYTDSLVRMFSNDNFLLGHARAGGLLAIDRISPFRKWLTRQSMGINYRQSRLARGLKLRSNTRTQP